MKVFTIPSALRNRTLTALVVTGVALSQTSQAQGFLGGLFKKDKNSDDVATINPAPGETPPTGNPANPRTVLSPGQLSAQEAAAQQTLASAQAQENAQNYGKAYSNYKSVVKSYPRTQAAAEAQFKMGAMLEAEGKEKKAFEEYQKAITLYKSSNRYNDSLNRQFAIAEGLRNSEKKGKLGGIGAAIQPSALVEMFQQIADNAPYTDFAPRSLLNIGYIYANQGDTPQAIMAFQSVADNYQSKQKYASEAQYQVFKLRGKMAETSFSPTDDRAQVEAGLDFVGRNPSDPRATDVKAQIGAIEDRKLEKLFNNGRFYEGQKRPKSAAVYYREIVKHPGSSRYEDAKKRLAAIESNDPSLIEPPRRQGGGLFGNRNDTVTQAPQPVVLPGQETAAAEEERGGLKKMFSGFGRKKEDVAEEAAYLGPPPPTVENKKPQMRTGNDNPLPIPTDDPTS